MNRVAIMVLVCLVLSSESSTENGEGGFRISAKWNGQVIAETNAEEVVELEGNTYFPENSIKSEYFKKSEETTFCPRKGLANYYDIEVKGKVNEGAAWYYLYPKPGGESIKGRVAFWKGVQVIKIPDSGRDADEL